jgi:hypothetical protein
MHDDPNAPLPIYKEGIPQAAPSSLRPSDYGWPSWVVEEPFSQLPHLQLFGLASSASPGCSAQRPKKHPPAERAARPNVGLLVGARRLKLRRSVSISLKKPQPEPPTGAPLGSD